MVIPGNTSECSPLKPFFFSQIFTNSTSTFPKSFHVTWFRLLQSTVFFFFNLALFSSVQEKAMATHSSTLAWKIPRREELGRLQSMGWRRVGHDWATSLSLSCIREGNGNPLQCSCLENPRKGGAWWAAVYGVAQSRTRLKWLSSSSSSTVQLLSRVWLSAAPWTAVRQAFLSITNSPSLLRFMSIESVMPSNHLILCHPLLLPPSIFPRIRVFSNESVLRIRWPKYWSFSFSINLSSEYSGLVSFGMDWLGLSYAMRDL